MITTPTTSTTSDHDNSPHTDINAINRLEINVNQPNNCGDLKESCEIQSDASVPTSSKSQEEATSSSSSSSSSTASSSMACVQNMLNGIAGCNRLYSMAQNRQIMDFFVSVHHWKTEIPQPDFPLLSQHVLSRLRSLGLVGTARAISNMYMNDPMIFDMGRLMAVSTYGILDQACANPCISYYILALIEAFLFACTTAEQKLSLEYTLWINELVNLYQIVAFQLTRNTIIWKSMEIPVVEDKDGKIEETLGKLRKELWKAAGNNQDQIPDVKFGAFAYWLKQLVSLRVFQVIPYDIQMRMSTFLSSDVAASKLKLTAARLRANRTIAIGDASIETRKWIGRHNFRGQYIASICHAQMVRDNGNDPTWAELIKELNKEGIVKNIVKKLFHTENNVYYQNISIPACIASAVGQVNSAWGL